MIKTAKVRRPDYLAFELNPLIGKLKTQPTNIAMQLDGLKIPNDLYQWYRENAEDPRNTYYACSV